MPASRRSGVTVRSSRTDIETPTAPVSRAIRTTIRAGRKPSKSQRFSKEEDPLLNPPEPTNLNVHRPPPQIPDNSEDELDTDTMRDFLGYEGFNDDNLTDADDGASDISTDDPLPSFGPQLSLAEDDAEEGGEHDDDVVNFSALNKDYYNPKVHCHFIYNTCPNGLIIH